ncbi:cytochrome P450 [Amycolatopsis samaneae]
MKFPFARPHPTQMPPEFAGARAAERLCRVETVTGEPAWLASRYEDVRFVLNDPRFSARVPAGPMGAGAVADNSLFQDPPGHTRLRRLVNRTFTSGRIEKLRPYTEKTVSALVDAMLAEGPPLDFMTAFATQVPARVITELLGVPDGARQAFRDAAADFVLLEKGQGKEEIYAKGGRVAELITQTIAAKREHPEDDLMTELISVQAEEDGRLTEAELVTMGLTLLIAGYMTTADAISMGTLFLLEHGLLGELSGKPDVVESAVEEILRYDPKVSCPSRVAKEDLDLNGTPVKAGEIVLASQQSANRDERQFDDAARFDIHREQNRHIAFGFGIHYCLGAQLARMELRVAFAALADRLVELRLSHPVTDLEWRTNLFGEQRIGNLGVTW